MVSKILEDWGAADYPFGWMSVTLIPEGAGTPPKWQCYYLLSRCLAAFDGPIIKFGDPRLSIPEKEVSRGVYKNR